jgi:hypothetical protein
MVVSACLVLQTPHLEQETRRMTRYNRFRLNAE